MSWDCRRWAPPLGISVRFSRSREEVRLLEVAVERSLVGSDWVVLEGWVALPGMVLEWWEDVGSMPVVLLVEALPVLVEDVGLRVEEVVVLSPVVPKMS